MTKGRITKGILLTTLFSGLAVIFFMLAFMTTTIPQASINDLIFGKTPVAMNDFVTNFMATFKSAFTNTWFPGLKAWGKEYFNFFTHLADPAWWAPANFINALVFYGFAATLIIYAIYALYTLIFGLFVYKKKKSSLLNILWLAIPTFCVTFLLVGLQGAIYGNASYADLMKGDATNGPINLLIWNIIGITKSAEGISTKIKAWGVLFSEIVLAVCLVVILYQLITNIYVGIPLYLHQHKYDYLEKAEIKRRKQFYKNHGYQNIANQQTDKKGKNKKNKKEALESNNPYVQQQQAAMGYTGAMPNPYMNPYAFNAYPVGGATQVNAIPSGGNTVHTGNNAPLIVQYITNGRDEEHLKSNQIDENVTSIYGTSRARRVEPEVAPQPVAPQPVPVVLPQTTQLSKDDIKEAVYDVLKENNLYFEGEEPVEETTKPESDYDVLTIEDLKALIKDSVQELLPKEEPKEVKEEPKPIEELKVNLEETIGEDTEVETTTVAPVQETDKVIPPIIVAMPTKIAEEDFEEVEEIVEEETEENSFDEENLRTLIASQLQEALKTIKVEEKETIQEVPIYVKEVEQPQQIIKEVIREVPTVKEIIKEVPVEKTVEIVKEVPVVEEVQVQKRPLIPQPEIRGKEKEIKKVEAVKLNFQEKLLTSGTDIVLAYNSIKNLLMSYGLKDRISNSGDTFRLHKHTYCKITMGGAHLKLYLALDPKNYLNTAIPVGNASYNELYREIPLVFRVKSDKSLARARELIVDCMNNKGLTQVGEEGNIDYASQLKNK